MRLSRVFSCPLSNPYAVSPLHPEDGVGFFAAPETEGPVIRLRLEDGVWRDDEIASGPGGCMSIISEPGRTGAYLAIMQCYPIFRFEAGGIFRLSPDNRAGGAVQRLFELPFVHRIETVPGEGGYHLVAATITQAKDSQEDWSRPGVVYHAWIPEDGEPGELTPVLEGLYHNHGMLRTRLDGRDVVLVSGDQGLFAITFDDSAGPRAEGPLLEAPISEVALVDLLGDGAPQLVTVEPFHGNRIALYRAQQQAKLLERDIWSEVWSAPAAFGHGLWGGTLRGEPAVLISDRRESSDLRVIRRAEGAGTDDEASGDQVGLTDESAAKGVSAANMAVVESDSQTYVAASEQATNEIAVYRVI